jgi:hypothetical protein
LGELHICAARVLPKPAALYRELEAPRRSCLPLLLRQERPVDQLMQIEKRRADAELHDEDRNHSHHWRRRRRSVARHQDDHGEVKGYAVSRI